jgi:signal transduction histidine kinase
VTRATSTSPERVRQTAAEAAEFGLRELTAIREIAHAFHTAKRPEEVFQFALDRVSPLVGAAFACVYVIDEDGDHMRLAAVHNWPQRYAKFLRQMRVRLGAGPSGEAAAERRAIEVLDVFSDRSLEDWQDVAMELGFRSLAALPLQTGTSVLGAVTFYFSSPNTVVSETRSLMRLVADQMAASAEKARLIEDLRQTNAALTASNEELARQYADLIEARRVKDDFLANVSHELRTPLTAVIGYISIMQEGIAGPMTDGQLDTLGQVKDASDHLLALIGDLLDLTALKRGDSQADLADLDARIPLRDAVATTKGRRAAVQLDVVEPDGAVPMIGDRRNVAKVIGILLNNSYKFTHNGSVRVTLDETGDRIAYVVRDTGVGIPEESHRVVFDEFKQVDGGMTREYSGAGLGLALARRLARLMHGDVTLVASTPGGGSTFRFELPRSNEQ